MGYYRVSQDPRIPHYMRYETKKEYLSANRSYNPYHKRPWNSSASDLNDRKRILSQAIVESKWSTTHYGQNPNRFVTASPLEANPTAIAGQGVGAYKGSKSAAGVSVNSTGTPTEPNFNTTFVQPNVDLKTLTLFGTPRAFVTDQPVMGSISTLCASSLREFQSSPTGDFVAWFPDYFGTHGQAPVLNVYDIEIIDFQMYHNDTFLTTHIGVSGDFKNFGSSVDLIDWMSSKGIVSIQVDQVMAQLFGITVEELNALYPPSFSGNFLQRYGMRPKVQEVPIIRSHVTEFMYAWRLFQLCWAAQYSTQVQFTFLPELYPGMRIKIADHNIEVYVQSVTHQGSRQGGFSTTAQVTCPVTRDANGKVKIIHFGFPFKKV